MRTKSQSVTTTRRRELPPPHPGETVAEIITGNGLTAYRVAQDIGVPAPRVNDVVLGKRAMTADLALRLAKYFGISAEFFMNLQSKYDLDMALDRIEDELATIPKFDRAVADAKVVRPRTMQREREVVMRPRKAAKARRTNGAT
jgi:addiction module HigA family antidote